MPPGLTRKGSPAHLTGTSWIERLKRVVANILSLSTRMKIQQHLRAEMVGAEKEVHDVAYDHTASVQTTQLAAPAPIRALARVPVGVGGASAASPSTLSGRVKTGQSS